MGFLFTSIPLVNLIYLLDLDTTPNTPPMNCRGLESFLGILNQGEREER